MSKKVLVLFELNSLQLSNIIYIGCVCVVWVSVLYTYFPFAIYTLNDFSGQLLKFSVALDA